jgi:hypothetical protein
MAGYNELLVGRYNRAIQKLLGMKGTKSLESLNPELHTHFALYYGVENRYLEGWDRFVHGGVSAAIAAKNSVWRFRNPANSNVMVVLEKLSFGGNIASQVQEFTGATNADYGTIAVTAGQVDSRSQRRNTLVISSSGDSSTSGGTVAFAGLFQYAPNQSPQDVIVNENQELTILPGQATDWVALSVNQGLLMGIMWRERFLEESERT